MVEAAKLPVKAAKPAAADAQAWTFRNLRREIDRLFDDFGTVPWNMAALKLPFGNTAWPVAPAVDFADTEKTFEITAELPGIDEKNIEVRVANGMLTIKGEKQDDKEEKKKDYYLRERNFGSFERSFQIPDGVDAARIEAKFNKGVLTVTLPKKPEAQAMPKKIEVKAA